MTMMHREMTLPGGLATNFSYAGKGRMMRVSRLMTVSLLGATLLGGCVQVTAPDKPIVIELNVNIRQEVIYRLAADAGNTIEENEDIF